MTASCMTEEELARWNLLNWQARLNTARATPCEDCTAAFAAEMRGLGLCNGFPGPQRYCVRCQRWWAEDEWHWRTGPRGLFCLVCHRKRQAARTYRRCKADPVRWAARKARQRENDVRRMAVVTNRAHKNAVDRNRKRTRYQADPEWREMVLARNRGYRARAKG